MRTEKRGWNPYLAGALSGVLLVLSVLAAGQYFGTSTSFIRTAGMIEKVIAPAHAGQVEYFRSIAPKIDWQWMFLVGILIGAFISALASGGFRLKATPEMWEGRFGPGMARRGLFAFTGGAIALFGAHMAGGCPSGHGLSGLSQLSVGGLVALMFFFVGGLLTARLLYGGGKAG